MITIYIYNNDNTYNDIIHIMITIYIYNNDNTYNDIMIIHIMKTITINKYHITSYHIINYILHLPCYEARVVAPVRLLLRPSLIPLQRLGERGRERE